MTAALSLAVLTTLYGAVLANVVVTPLAARLHVAAEDDEDAPHDGAEKSGRMRND